jgi:4-diphosphocytidyl-2C-methyl-D-erythritol kinase
MNSEHRTSNIERSITSNLQFEAIGDGLLVRAPGKINLSLLVAGKRPDGYHELETIMAKINWYDEILIEKVVSSGCGCDARFVKRPTSNVTNSA